MENTPTLQELISFYEKYFPIQDGTIISSDPFKKSAKLIDLKPYTHSRRRKQILSLERDMIMYGWHQPEVHSGTTIRWSGPSTTSKILITKNKISEIKFNIRMATGLNQEDLKISVGALEFETTQVITGNTCILPIDETQDSLDHFEISFTLKNLAMIFPDERLIGICVSSFQARFE